MSGRVCIVSGSRDLEDVELVAAAVRAAGWVGEIDVVIHGGARGIDTAAHQWAVEQGIPVDVFPADWDRYGKAAGMRRNADMAVRACAVAMQTDLTACCIAIPGPGSVGTWGMVKICERKGIPVSVYQVRL